VNVTPRLAKGTIVEKPSGWWWGRFTTAQGRRAIEFVTCETVHQAEERRVFVAAQLVRLRQAGREQFSDKLLGLASKAEPSQLERVKRGVDAIVAGDYEKPLDPELPDTGPSFREFATAWTSGELARRFPDHMDKRSSMYLPSTSALPSSGQVTIPFRRT
jgi:hypothetical protein